MIHTVRVQTACRIHFGMFSFGHVDQRQYGGVGVMVEPPLVSVTVEPAAETSVVGPLAERARQFATRAIDHWRVHDVPPCKLSVSSPRDHIGLGVGTQLGLAVAVAMRRFLELAELSLGDLAASVSRGKRSAVGTHGFEQGGLIVDGGKREDDALGVLVHRVAMPRAWRFVLITSGERQGLKGDAEVEAFAKLPPVPSDVTGALWSIVERELLPAISREDCDAFGEALYRFGRMAGECFEVVQGGPYANSAVARIVEAVRGLGVQGVGQSSWGPTVFAVTPTEAAADELVTELINRQFAARSAITIARPCNHGAIIE